jgi:hypothetical protein
VVMEDITFITISITLFVIFVAAIFAFERV